MRTRRQTLPRAPDLRARLPALNVTLKEKVSSPETTALFYVENCGTEDLDSVVVFRPVTLDLDARPSGENELRWLGTLNSVAQNRHIGYCSSLVSEPRISVWGSSS